MIFDLSNEYDIPKYKEYVNKLYEKRSIVEVKEKHPKRSIPQNSYLHLILSFFACEYGCSIEEAKVLFYKRECNKEIYQRTGINKRGKEVEYLRSSKELTTEEMTISIDRFRNWSSSVAGIYLPAPNEDQMLVFALKEVERNQAYL